MDSNLNQTPPPAAFPETETNRYLAKFKTACIKNWSYTRMEPLYTQGDLSRFLWALERKAEALEIVHAFTSIITTPPHTRNGKVNYNIWCPVAEIYALEIYISRLAGNTDAANNLMANIMADPGIADNPDVITDSLAEAPEKIEQAFADTSTKWACQVLSRTVSQLILLQELAIAGHQFGTYFSSDQTEELIAEARLRLKDRLIDAA